jgi:hypothetical protein
MQTKIYSSAEVFQAQLSPWLTKEEKKKDWLNRAEGLLSTSTKAALDFFFIVVVFNPCYILSFILSKKKGSTARENMCYFQSYFFWLNYFYCLMGQILLCF